MRESFKQYAKPLIASAVVLTGAAGLTVKYVNDQEQAMQQKAAEITEKLRDDIRRLDVTVDQLNLLVENQTEDEEVIFTNITEIKNVTREIVQGSSTLGVIGKESVLPRESFIRAGEAMASAIPKLEKVSWKDAAEGWRKEIEAKAASL